MIHTLKHGRALCGQPGVPGEWPKGHRWVSFEDEANLHEVDCPGCLADGRTDTGKGNREGNFVVLNQYHADELFPEPGREGLRAACHEMLENGPCLVILKGGEFKVQPLANADDVGGPSA